MTDSIIASLGVVMNKHSTILIVFFTVFLDLLGFGILIPLLPYIPEQYGATKVETGILMASYSIAQFIFAPFLGRLSDRIGRRPIMVLSLIGSVVGYVIFAFANSLTGLFIARIIAGCAAANISTAHAIIADSFPKEERTKGMGMVGAAIGLGFVLGPAMAGFLVGENHNYTLTFLTAAALSGFDLILVFFLLPETLNLRADNHIEDRRLSFDKLKSALQVMYIPQLLLISLLYYIAFSAMESTFAFFGMDQFDLDERHNSYILFGVGIVLVIVQAGIVRVASKRFGDRNLLLFGISGVLLGLVLMASSTSLGWWIFFTMVMAAASGFVIPSLTSIISQVSSQEVQGGILGLNQSMASMGRIVGPLLGPMIFEYVGPRTPFLVCAGLVLAALLFVIPMKYNTR
jgi:DHA1 family tetracycline resistance protein-like MFS transporter